MCELFGMSALHPTTVRLSLEEFSKHGGLAGPHKDGWGLAWYDARDLRLVKEANPASTSACVQFIQNYPLASDLVVSHIRRATRGDVATRNCQPFMRELGGVWHCFAHNGDLQDAGKDPRLQWARHRPVGETDSEAAFCALMDTLAPLWTAGRTPPALQARRQVLERFAAILRELGPANFIYSDGDLLAAHADRRHQEDGSMRPPGLWQLARRCPAGGELDALGLRVASKGAEQEVVLVASVPLTGEGWTPLARGELLIARQGRLEWSNVIP